MQYHLRLTIRNEGRALARRFGMDLDFPAGLRPQPPRLDGKMRMPGAEECVFIEEGDAVWRVKLRSPTACPPVYPGETVQILASPYTDGDVRYRITEELVRDLHSWVVPYRLYCEHARMVQGSVPLTALYDNDLFPT